MENIFITKENISNLELGQDTVSKWERYQQLIKEEIILNEIENSIELLKKNFYEYYKSKLTIKESCDYNSIILGISTGGINKINTHVELEENSEKKLLEVFEPLRKFFFQFRNNIQHVLNLIENLKSNDEMDQIVNLLCHFFYDNISIQKPEQEEILLISYYLIEREIEKLNSPSVSSFLNGSFIGKLLKSFSRRQDIKSYLSMILGDLILNMEKSTINFLEIDVSRINDHIRNKKTIEILNKSFNLEKVKKMFEIDKKKFLSDRIRKTTITTKNIKKSHITPNTVHNINPSPSDKLQITFPTHSQIAPSEDKNKTIEKNLNLRTLGSKSFCIDLNNEELNLDSNSNQQKKELFLLQKIFANKKKSINFQNNDLLNQIEIARTARNSIATFNNLSRIMFIDEETDEDDDYNYDYYVDLTEEQLTQRYENERNMEMKELYLRQIKKIEDDKNIFTNQKFLDNISIYAHNSCKVLYIYKRNFEEIKLLIDQLFTNLIENNSTIPYVIKCICKIIEILITRKFPNISLYDKNSFIGEFIFGKLIMIILTNPDYNGIISNTVISLNTRKNLVIINKILKKISRASFFDGVYESNYTLFNIYLIEIMPMINNFFEKLTVVKLPSVIEDLINKRIENLQTVDYFENNRDELINLQSICFSISDVFILYKTVKNNLELFSQDLSIKKSLEKIEIKENFLLKKMKDHTNKNVKKYYIIFKIINNPSKFELLYPVQNRFTFNINQQEENFELTINRMKFCVKTILRSLNGINSTIYSHLSEADTTEKLFHALNKIIELEDFADNMTNDKIPLSWYSLYLTSNLSKLQNYFYNSKEGSDLNNSLFHPDSSLNRLYLELYEETRKEIEILNYKSNLVMTKYGINLRCSEKLNEILKREVIKVKQIEKFVRIEKFIQNGKISVCLRSKNSGHMNVHSKDEDHNNSKDSNLSNKSSSIFICKQENCVHHKYNYLDKAIEGKPERKNIINTSKDSLGSTGTGISLNFVHKNSHGTPLIDKLESHCDSIEEFINTFQQFNEIIEDIVLGDQRNKIYETIENYLNIVKEQLEKDELFCNIYNSETILEVIEDIENYMIKKMYKNTFPENELQSDNLFYEQCLKFKWITPVHLEINDKYIYENLWQSAINYIKRMDSEKSPVEKLKCVHSAYKILNNCISFCAGKHEYAGLDDIFPIFIYVLIKSEPRRMFSNMQYIKTFMSPGRLLANYGFLLTQIEGSVNFILEINQNSLKISEEEYKK